MEIYIVYEHEPYSHTDVVGLFTDNESATYFIEQYLNSGAPYVKRDNLTIEKQLVNKWSGSNLEWKPGEGLVALDDTRTS